MQFAHIFLFILYLKMMNVNDIRQCSSLSNEIFVFIQKFILMLLYLTIVCFEDRLYTNVKIKFYV